MARGRSITRPERFLNRESSHARNEGIESSIDRIARQASINTTDIEFLRSVNNRQLNPVTNRFFAQQVQQNLEELILMGI